MVFVLAPITLMKVYTIIITTLFLLEQHPYLRNYHPKHYDLPHFPNMGKNKRPQVTQIIIV